MWPTTATQIVIDSRQPSPVSSRTDLIVTWSDQWMFRSWRADISCETTPASPDLLLSRSTSLHRTLTLTWLAPNKDGSWSVDLRLNTSRGLLQRSYDGRGKSSTSHHVRSTVTIRYLLTAQVSELLNAYHSDVVNTESLDGPVPRFCNLVFGQDNFNPNVEASTQSFSSVSTTDDLLFLNTAASSAYAKYVKCRWPKVTPMWGAIRLYISRKFNTSRKYWLQLGNHFLQFAFEINLPFPYD